jgi:beta-N-acetylhexosaminidase
VCFYRKLFLNLLLIFITCVIFGSVNLCSQELKQETREKIRRIAAKIVSSMSDEDKAGQVIHIAIPGKEFDDETAEEIRKIHPGGIILFNHNLGTKNEIRSLTKNIQQEAQKLKLPPLFISTDQEGGRVIRVEKGVTAFPGAMAIGQSLNSMNASNVGFLTSYQLNRLGINVIIAPSLDINNNPDNPVINTRSFGSDVDTVTRLGILYEQGAREGGALAVIKHFPGHGDTNVDSHLGLPTIDKTEQELDSFELIPFKTAIVSGARALMSAHIVYPEIDPNFPATLSEKILTKILREKLKFSGLVFTDAMEMDAIAKNYKDYKRGSLAILAGADIILLTSYGKNTLEYRDMILESIRKKEFIKNGVNLLDEALIRQISLKIEQGLFLSNTSFFKVEEEDVNAYITTKRKKASDKYEVFKKQGIEELNRKISMDSVRSFRKFFTPPKPEVIKSFTFVINNDRMKEDLELLDIVPVSDKKFKRMMKSKIKATYVFDTKDQIELNRIAKYIRLNPGSNYIVLHYGSPFLVMPTGNNVDILFSFSPTDMSVSALVLRAFNSESENIIMPADLIFKGDSIVPGKKE